MGVALSAVSNALPFTTFIGCGSIGWSNCRVNTSIVWSLKAVCGTVMVTTLPFCVWPVSCPSAFNSLRLGISKVIFPSAGY